LVIFCFAILETFGLGIRWVRPEPELYTVQPGGAIDPASVAAIDEPKLKRFLDNRTQSLGDQMLYQALLASADVLDISEARATPVSSPPKSSHRPDPPTAERTEDRQSLPAPAASTTPYTEISSTLEGYRRYLLDAAVARQEPLETLGDTMLKLAFMGTVYGISKALFAARGLDTANPVLKLLAKAEMYSGIGTGFGTTLTGIILSILAAQSRSVLFGAWSEKIGRVYELVLDFRFEGFLSLVERLKGTGAVLTGRSPTASSYEQTSVDFFQLVGIVVVVGLLFAAFVYFVKGYLPR
jgi:hypothetical protein